MPEFLKEKTEAEHDGIEDLLYNIRKESKIMPFGPYTDFKDCVSKNSDKANPEGFCSWLHKQITGVYPGEMSFMSPDAMELYMKAYGDSLESSGKPVATAEKEAHAAGIQKLNESGWVYARMGWVKQYSSPSFRNILNVRIFASGTWTDSSGYTREWADEDLDQLVTAFNSGVPGIVPLKAGHTSDSFNQAIAEKLGVPVDVVTGEMGHGQISIGRMATLERRGNLLMASFERVPEPIADLIEGGLFSTVSVEIEDEIGGFASAITGVALLGAEEPAVDEATLDRALVFGGKRNGAIVYSFGKGENPNLAQIEREFETLRDRMSETIKGMRGAPIFRAMLSNLRTLFDQIRKKQQHQASDIPAEIQAYADAHYQGSVDALIAWVRNVGFDQCVAGLTGKPEITDPVKVCGWLKGRAHAHSTKEDDINMSVTLKDLVAKMQEPGDAMSNLIAIATALGLGEDATLEDIINAIEALKTAGGGTPAEQMAAELKKAQDRIAELEKDQQYAKYLERTRLFTAVPGKKPEDIAVEVNTLHYAMGKEKAEEIMGIYQKIHDMGKAAGKALGSSRQNTNAVELETAIQAYMKDHPDVTRGEATKSVILANPSLKTEFNRQEREVHQYS